MSSSKEGTQRNPHWNDDNDDEDNDKDDDDIDDDDDDDEDNDGDDQTAVGIYLQNTQSLWQHAHHLRRSNPDVVSLLKEGIEMPPPLTQNPSRLRDTHKKNVAFSVESLWISKHT